MGATSADASAFAAASAAATEFGLSTRVDGFYDWAGRRLFLLDGSPDPMTPGAYRYQSHPDLCDLSAPESDPSSPRYEPPHLRHQPGDDWEIGGKPDDPDDPGPFGNPLWRPDLRTGRHRRGELPDPLPPEDAGPEPQSASAGSVPPWRPPRRTSSAPPEPPEDESADAPVPVTPDRPSPEPRDRSRFWSEADSTRSESTMNSQRRNRFEVDARNSDCDSGGESDSATEPRPVPGFESDPFRFGSPTEPRPVPGLESDPFRFGKLREGAWDRWLDKSAGLAADHQRTHAFLQREGGWAVVMIVVFFEWLVAAVRGPAKVRPPQPDRFYEPALQPVQYGGTSPQLVRRSGTGSTPGNGDTGTAPGTAQREKRNEPTASGPLPAPAQREGGEPATAPRGRAEAKRRTALAVRSTRLALAVRGAQRARVQTGGPAKDESPAPPRPRPGDEPRAESFGAKPVSGAGPRSGSFGANPASSAESRPGSFGAGPVSGDNSRPGSFGARLLGGAEYRPGSFGSSLTGGAAWA